MTGKPTNSGENLRKLWSIPAKQVRFHQDGRFFMPVDRFPAALCDPNGYFLIPTPEDRRTNERLHQGVRLNLTERVSELPGYVRMT